MRIAFDMDGVLADMDLALAQLAKREFGASLADPDAAAPAPPDRPAELPATVLARLSPREQARLWQHVHDTRNFWETLAECEPGMVRRLQELAHERRWDVLFLTQRPASDGRTPQLQSQHWLRRHGFEYPAVYTTEGSRGRIAAALTLDVHVDDRLEHCVDVSAESKAWPILIWREEASFARISAGSAKHGIAAVGTVGDAIARIEQADRATTDHDDHAALRRRLKRVFMGR